MREAALVSRTFDSTRSGNVAIGTYLMIIMQGDVLARFVHANPGMR